MALGGLHVGSPAVALALLGVVSRGALSGPALRLLAVHRHRSSNSVEARSVPRTT
jgi:hypothetical protein